MGQSFLFEENQALGFLPLRSYFESKKDRNNCQKTCPPEMEDIVRCLIQRDCLESLKCSPAKEESKNDQTDQSSNIFDLIDNLGSGHVPVQMKKKPLIVLDAQNIAMRHGVDV